MADEPIQQSQAAGDVPRRSRGRVRSMFAASRVVVQIVFRDPEHVPERLTLKATERLGEPSLAWAQTQRAERPGADPAVIADELRHRSATVARIDGAIAGTPFFVAIVPGYVSYLWQEAMMVLRMAALYGRDPRELSTAAEALALRGVHPTPQAAQAALKVVLAHPLPDKPPHRRPLRNWIQSIRMVLVFGGFLSPPAERTRTGWRSKLMAVAELLLGVIVWLVTWVLPVTFIVAMAWGCESHTRELGRRAHAFYRGEAATTEKAIAEARGQREQGHEKRRLVRTVVLFLSIAIPIAFVAYAGHVRNTTGVSFVGAIGALVALSFVIATTVVASRG